MQTLRKTLEFIFGNPDDKNLEDHIPIVLSFTTATLSLVASVSNIIIGLAPILNYIALTSTISMYFVYYMLRKGHNPYFYKLLMTVTCFLYFNLLWFTNYASSGPNLYLFLLFLVFLLMIFEGRHRIFFLSFLVVNIMVLFYIEHQNISTMPHYISENDRIDDIYISFFIYLVFTFVMAMSIRYYYLKERNNAKRSDHLKSAFLANMSHEIRTPMSAILGFSKLLDYASSDDERRGYVSIINENGKMLMQLLDDIIDMSKMDAGQFDITKKGFSLNTLLDEMNKATCLLLEQLGKKNIMLTVVTAPHDVFVYTDESRLRQILFNFLSNAAKFTMHGKISFGYSLVNKDIAFFVSDTGIGIEEEYSEKIFNRFFKVENLGQDTLPRGTGIGLSIVKILVEKLGGHITLESEYGKGSVFRFVLPEIVIQKLPDVLIEDDPNLVFSPKNKVLIVEDDISNMMLAANVLKKLGLPFLQAVNGELAIESYKQHPEINLVLLDINLPIMDGYATVRELKKLSPDLPVVAVTAHAMSDEKESAFNTGFDDYITKPVERSVLLECLRKYLILKSKLSE